MTAKQSPQVLSFGTESISSLLRRFSWPAIVGAVTTALYNFVDRIFIGHGVGADGLAAVSVTYPLMLIMMSFGMLIAFGGNTLAVIHLGKKQFLEAEKVLGHAFSLYLVLTALFVLFGFTFMSPLLSLFGASHHTLPLAESYFSIILLGVLGHEISFGMNSFIRGAGAPGIAMVTLLIGAVLNVLLDGLFIFTFHWGLRGAALATIIAQAVSASWVMRFFLGGSSAIKLRASNMRLQLHLIKRILVAGSPMWMLAIAGCAGQALLNNRLLMLGGDDAVTIMAIVFSIYSLVRMPVLGLSQGAQPVIGYNYGAGDYQRVRAALKITVMRAFMLTSVCFIALELFPQQLLGIFNIHDRSLLSIGSYALRSFMLILPLIGFQIVATGYFQAIGKAAIALQLTLCHQVFLLLPLILILPHFFGLQGIWLAGPVAELLACLITVMYLRAELKSRLVEGKEKAQTAHRRLNAAV